MNDPLLRLLVFILLLVVLVGCLIMSTKRPRIRTEITAQRDARSIGDGAWAADPRASSYTQAHYPMSRANRRVVR